MEVLIVDDSNVIRSILQTNIENQLTLKTHIASNMQEAKALINQHHEHIDIAVIDLNLPDAPNGELLDFIQDQNIPAIVLTASYDDELRQALLDRHVIDYVIKNNVNELVYVIELIQRLNENPETKILVVDDDTEARQYIANILLNNRYQVEQASSGEQAIEILKQDDSIELMVTDYLMPKMDGVELINRVREFRKRDDMAIIGVSAADARTSSPRLLKAGANDFIKKPFLPEEFNCRLNQNIDSIKLIKKLKDTSVRDHLTGLYNRKFLYESGRVLHANAKRDNGSLAVAMIDIDQFKNINDTYGHQAGDLVIKHVAANIAQKVRKSDIVARYGGEEFCVLLNDAEAGNLMNIMDDIRSKIENSRVLYDNQEIRFTISVGVSNELDDSLDNMLNIADRLLYQAKQTGRNKVQCAAV